MELLLPWCVHRLTFQHAHKVRFEGGWREDEMHGRKKTVARYGSESSGWSLTRWQEVMMVWLLE